MNGIYHETVGFYHDRLGCKGPCCLVAHTRLRVNFSKPHSYLSLHFHNLTDRPTRLSLSLKIQYTVAVALLVTMSALAPSSASKESRRDKGSPYQVFHLRHKMVEQSNLEPVDSVGSNETLKVLPGSPVSLSRPLPLSKAGKQPSSKSGKTSQPSSQPSSLKPTLEPVGSTFYAGTHGE